MPGKAWSDAELGWFLSHPDGTHQDFAQAGHTRTFHAWRMKRSDLNLGKLPHQTTPLLSDNAIEPEVSWREWNGALHPIQVLRKKARGSLDGEAEIFIESDAPVAFVVLGDSHIGAWSTNHDLFEAITDEILSVPNLYIALMGDLAHMAVKLRGVTEVMDNILPPTEQLLYLQSWLKDVQERVLFATWGNHEISRAEDQLGVSPFADLYRKMCRHYFNGIGHVTVRVNQVEYHIAASHHFLGKSIYNPCHGAQRYLERVGIDRDIAVAGDSHVPGVLKFTHGPMTKLAVNCGSAQTMSGYAARYFSLITHPVFPVVCLGHESKRFWAHWSVGEYLDAQRVTQTFDVA